MALNLGLKVTLPPLYNVLRCILLQSHGAEDAKTRETNSPESAECSLCRNRGILTCVHLISSSIGYLPQTIIQSCPVPECQGLFVLSNSRYRAVKCIGSGSFALTFLALDLYKNNEKVAIKISNLDSLDISTRELAILRWIEGCKGDIQWPGIVSILDAFFLPPGYICIVQEYLLPVVDICNLSSPLNKLFCIASVAGQILQGLYFLHSAGLIHADIKVDNIMRRRGLLEEGKLGVASFSDFDRRQLSCNHARSPGGCFDRPRKFHNTFRNWYFGRGH